jgi:hypothetical protein
MNFPDHLVNYYEGEWLEAVLLTVFGILTAGVVVAIWRCSGHNVLLKGLFYPIAALAALTFFAGGFGVYNNSQRLALKPSQYSESPADFVRAEHNRFEGANGVNTWWMPLKLLWTALVLAGIGISFFTRSVFANGIAIGFICIGAMGFVIDGFAHHRAKLYTAALLAHNSVPQ